MIEKIISHQNYKECDDFFENYFCSSEKKILFVGTLGFSKTCLHFPRLIANKKCLTNIDFVFFNEVRPRVSQVLQVIANDHKTYLPKLLNRFTSVDFIDIEILAPDMANVGGRNAVDQMGKLLSNKYTDVVIDASAMSRGVCFPIVRYAYNKSNTIRTQVHVVISADRSLGFDVDAESKDSAEYMHGFQADMETDAVADSINLWLPQLSEKNRASLSKVFEALKAEEVAPILPFPSSDPKRGDTLLCLFRESIINEWETNLLDIIYAHEANPMDVYETITCIYVARLEALEGYTPRIVLSPTGRKIGSLGMLFAAILLDLPVMYVETMGYRCNLTIAPNIPDLEPTQMWHNWLLT